jgi:light-regulated signal transduction histidine kinase (bacteriophytochrome)
VSGSPAFGQADLTNCERELIHLAGSVQPHGVLLAVDEQTLVVMQASANAAALMGADAQWLLGKPVQVLGGDLQAGLAQLANDPALDEPVPLKCRLAVAGAERVFEGAVHRVAPGVLLLEIEPVEAPECETVSLEQAQLLAHLGQSVEQVSLASNIGNLADVVVKRFRDMLGYDRVMVYKFDPDGHGKIIAEARDPRLESLLGHHYPASDIPQRARELYIRNRLRVLVNVNYEPAALVPRRLPGAHDELDMSMCYLRSMSPLHLQYLKNMGVTATLVVSLVREGRLWGLIACHHYTPRNLRLAVRAAADLLAEVISTRISAIENYVHAQVAIQVRRLEQRLVEATSTEGDWRLALFRNPHTLLQPLDATGAALFYEDEILSSGEVPSTPEMRALARWVHEQEGDGLFSCNSVARANAALNTLTPTASGVLAVRLSVSRPDYLMWFRKEQLHAVTWAGDPTKPVVGNDPLELSPRRSFAAWSEIVRGTALPWSSAEIALARAFGASLADIVVQVSAVRLLIAQHQLELTRATVANSREPVVIINADQRVLFANDAFFALARLDRDPALPLEALAAAFTEPGHVHGVIASLCAERRAWRGRLDMAGAGGQPRPVTVRAEPVPARDGSLLGFFLIFDDLSDSERAVQAREHLEQSLARASAGTGAGSGPPLGQADEGGADGLLEAVLSNASLAAMDVADGGAVPALVTLLEEIDSSAQRATRLYERVRAFSGQD